MISLLAILRRIFISRLGSSIIGIIAISSLIWYAGPRIGLTSVSMRLAIIGIILLIFLLIMLIRWLWAKKRGENLHNQLQAQEESVAGRALEIELLKEKMLEAVASLKSSELGVKYRGNAALYALPWYMIIGPSACGKSTLLRNSGLHFPFASNEDLQIKGFGGTKNCDWWFSDEAVILDTAGRYTTEENDKDEWLSFLDLIKKNRPRLPINGIIVSVSLVDLLTGEDDVVSWHVKVIRDRIEELYNRLGYVFPVTLLFTKCDLLKGFQEFFTDLGERDRRQVWGMNLFDVGDDYDVQIKAFSERLDDLYAKLTLLRLHKLSVERNLQRKVDIYDFPEEFNAAFTRINEFAKLLFKENPYQETPVFSGAYFTSGTQEGAPIQRLIGDLRKAFGYVENDAEADLQVVETKSYFIKDLFSKVIFPNKDSAARTRKRLRMYLWAKTLGVGACLAALLITFMLYSTSLTSNVLLVKQGEKVARNLVTEFSGKKLTNNQVMAQLIDGYNYYDSLVDYRTRVPLHLRLGLYRGNTQIRPLQDMLLYVMNKCFLQNIGVYLQKQLLDYHKSWVEADGKTKRKMRGKYYTTLKAYLMLSFPNRIDVDQATSLLSSDWSKLLTVNADEYSDLVRFYMQHLSLQDSTAKAWYADENIVKAARAQLYSPTNSNNLYAQIISTGANNLQSIALRQLVNDYGASLLISDYKVPGIYTRKAWYDYVKPEMAKIVATASQGDWVIDTSYAKLNETQLPNKYTKTEARHLRARLRIELRDLYFNDYAHAWFKLLSSVRVQRFQSLDDADKQILILVSADGPIVQLLNAFVDNMNVTDNTHIHYVHELKEPFADLRKIIAPDKKASVSDPVKSYLKELTAVQNDLQRLSASPNVERQAQTYASHLLSGSGGGSELYRSMIAVNMFVNRLDDVDAHQALKSLLLQPIRESWRAVLKAATRGLDQQWQAQVASDFTRNIADKFPFDKNSGEDAALSDVADFFQPKDGLLWSFVNTYLQPFLTADEHGWHEQTWLGVGAGFSKDFLQTLTQAKHISEGLFRSGGSTLGFTYQIYPIPTPGLSQIILVANGNSYHYHNGPQEWHSFKWPSNTINQDSYLSAVAAAGANPSTVQAQGNWGLFHVISKARLRAQKGSIYKATWSLRNHAHNFHIKLLMRSDRRDNIFAEILLNKFTIPKHLFDNLVG